MKPALRRGSWIVTVPVAAVAVAYATFFFLPERCAIGEARRQIRQKQDYIVRSGGLAPALRIAQQELEQAQVCNAAWEQHAPTEPELSALYGTIHGIAKAAGTRITRLDPEPVSRYEKISHVPLTVECIGSFAEICGFLEGIESLPLSIWVNELRLNGTGQNAKSIRCQLTLAVFTNNLENSDYVEHSE